MKVNPKGNKKGESRVARGGSWYCDIDDCRSAERDLFGPSRCYNRRLGFRVVVVKK